MPVRVGGRVTAVVYADEAAQSSERLPASWASAIQILARHAGHCLEVLTALHVSQFADSGQLTLTEPPPVAAAERQPVSERQPVDDTEDAARRYARLLLSEIKLYNETAVTAGREQKDLFERLRPEIERARGLYEARVSPSLRARNLYFEQELVRTLADGDPNLLGGLVSRVRNPLTCSGRVGKGFGYRWPIRISVGFSRLGRRRSASVGPTRWRPESPQPSSRSVERWRQACHRRSRGV